MFCEVRKGEAEGRLLLQGEAPLSELKLSIVPNTLLLSEEQSQHLEQVVASHRSAGRVVTDNPIYRLESWAVGEFLHLQVSERSYFDSVLLKQYPQWGLRSQVLAVVCVTQCADGLILEKRSEKVAALPGYLHPAPSGSVEPPSHPLETLYEESREELGLLPKELTDVVCLGLVYGELSGVYQLVCRASTDLSLHEIDARSCEGRWERASLTCAPLDPKGLPRWIAENRERLTIGGRVALQMEGGRQWGPSWFEEQEL